MEDEDRQETIITAIGTLLVALITGICSIITTLIAKKTNKKVDEIENINKVINGHILESDKTYLTDFLSELQSGIEKSPIQKERAHEIYDRYCKNGGNSYIHTEWEKCISQGLI